MGEPRWLSADEMTAWRAYLFASYRLERRIEEQLKADAGLTHGQYEVLVLLSEAPEHSLRMTELARRAVVSKSAMTYQISQMENAGLVERTSCPSDERGVVAVLTSEGMRLLKRTAPGHVDVVRRYLMDNLSPSDLRALTRIATKMGAALEDRS